MAGREGLRPLPHRDPYLARFERWIEDKLAPLPQEVARPVEHFAKWHHLRRIRTLSTPDAPVRAPVHSAKQEITETVKFLQWLWDTHRRTAAECTQQDTDIWLAEGPSTRKLIRTFFVAARNTGLNTRVEIGHYSPRSRPTLAPGQRTAWLRELLTGTSESLPYRLAGILLVLYAQPLARVAELRTGAIEVHNATGAMEITFGPNPVPVPEAIAELIRQHLQNRPNLRTAAGTESPWVFPGTRAGQHLHPQSITDRLRGLGIDLRGARNHALDEHVLASPPPIVADALGYSHQAAFLHAETAGEPWARYANLKRQP